MHSFSLLLSNLESFDENTRNDFCIFLRTLSLLNETQNSTILWNLIEKVILGLLSESDIQIIDQLQDMDFEKLIDTVNTEYQLVEIKKNYQTQVDSLKRKLEETENNSIPKRRKLEEDKSIEENEDKLNAKQQNLPKWKILQINSAKEAQEREQQEKLIKSQKINEIIQKSIQKDDQKVQEQQDEELKKKLVLLNEESSDLANKFQQREEECETVKDRIMLLEKLKGKKELEKKALLIKKRRIAEENDHVSTRRRAMKEERERIDKNLS
uniref:Uncharacterized protein n=1 Tax=Arcella intermedia TaxID=1963864 RepID=A0A6B2LCJ9_9EUKA